MSGARRPAGVFLIAVGLAVGVYFVTGAFFAANDTFDVEAVWNVLDVLMFFALAIGLVLLYMDKLEERRQHAAGEGDLRRYIALNAAFYVTAGIAILFLHNWLSLLAQGRDYMDDSATAGMIWVVVDTVLPIALGVTGLRQLRR